MQEEFKGRETPAVKNNGHTSFTKSPVNTTQNLGQSSIAPITSSYISVKSDTDYKINAVSRVPTIDGKSGSNHKVQTVHDYQVSPGLRTTQVGQRSSSTLSTSLESLVNANTDCKGFSFDDVFSANLEVISDDEDLFDLIQGIPAKHSGRSNHTESSNPDDIHHDNLCHEPAESGDWKDRAIGKIRCNNLTYHFI